MANSLLNEEGRHWESVGDYVLPLGADGKPAWDGAIRVYSCFDQKHKALPPTVYFTATAGPFSLGFHISAASAREFAKNLLSAADKADEVSAELQRLSEPQGA